MSGFKRYQSKVFWGRMASQDLSQDFPAYRDSPLAARTRSPVWDSEDTRETSSNGEKSSSFDDDSTDAKNITAIRVFVNEPASEQSQPNKAEKSIEPSTSELPAPRADVNSINQDFRSQDSGFSDSERSNDSLEVEAPRRRRRRRKIKERELAARNRIGVLWPENAGFPSPAHASTPKTRGFPNLRKKAENSRTDESNEIENASFVSLEKECLEDFLYATEPPEDAESIVKSDRSSTVNSSTRSRIDHAYREKSSPTRAWLCDLATDTANECGVTLQSKSLPRRKNDFCTEAEANDSSTLSTVATAAASKLLVRADQFDRHYKFIVEKLTHQQRETGCRSEMEFLRAIEDDAYAVLVELGAPPPRRIQQSSSKGILKQLSYLKNEVDSVMETRLDFYVERIVRGLEDTSREDSTVVRGSLAALTALGLAGPRAGDSIARCSGVRALLTSLISAGRLSSDFRAATLRALASVCCSSKAIERFVKDDGPEILTDLLATRSSPERERMEAAALVVQLTAAWTDAQGLPYLEPYADSLIPSITDLGESTECGQTLLLTTAALNQLSKSRRCVAAMLEHDTVRRVLKSVKKTTGSSVWVMEQVASLVGELARYPEARPYLARARASVALVCFLRMRPPGLEDAYRRLESTAAAALTRLCVDQEIAKQVVAVGGADCLPTYGKNEVTEDDEQSEVGLLKYTKSLRRACRKAAKQIDSAKMLDYSAFG